MEALNPTVLQRAYKDREAGVREQAVILSGKLLERFPDLIQLLITGIEDEEIRVRYLSSLELGSGKGEKVIDALARVAARDGENPWLRAAVLSGVGDQLSAFLSTFRKIDTPDRPAFPLMMEDLGELYGHAAQMEDCQVLLKDMVTAEGALQWRMASALGLLKGLEGRGVFHSEKGLLHAMVNHPSSELGMEAMKDFIDQVALKALEEEGSLSSKLVATTLMGYAPFEWVENGLRNLLKPNIAVEIQLEAVKSLGRISNPEAGLILLSKDVWASYTPRLKSAVISAMVSRRPTMLQLLAAIEAQVVAPAAIPSMIRQRLMNEANDTIKERATLLFNELEGGGRMAVYEDFLEVLNHPADPGLGKVVFEKTCSSCHSYAGEGGEVGPDLTSVKNQPGDALLLHTIVPNYEVLPAYQATTISINDGRAIAGWISAESDNSITLRTAFGTDESILRSNIESIQHSGLSLMPDGLEQTMTKEDMANLIAYLKSGGV